MESYVTFGLIIFFSFLVLIYEYFHLGDVFFFFFTLVLFLVGGKRLDLFIILVILVQNVLYIMST